MGTRNLTMVVSDSQIRIAQYGQWDGYPSGQGRTALKFAKARLSTKEGREKFKKRLEKVRLVSDEECRQLWASIGVTSEYATSDQVRDFNEQWPYFTRDLGAEILSAVWKAKNAVLVGNAADFAGDSLFCEWAYVIDLDKKTFEVYKGFNKLPLDPEERFASCPRDKKPDGTLSEYYPVKHVKTWSLKDLPSSKAFVAALEPDDEDEDEDEDEDGTFSADNEDET